MKILIIGGNGLFGGKLKEFLKNKDYNIFSTYYNKNNNSNKENNYQLDIKNEKEVEKLIKKISPNIIINTAAFTNVDGCEKEREKALHINAKSIGFLAKYSKRVNAKFIQISTDYVFDGKKGLYIEDDKTNPINYYGFTKLKGEEILKDYIDDHIIARTSVIYGENKNNFVLWIINKLKDKKEINIVDNQFISPTFNLDLSEQIESLIKKDSKGIFHTAGAERISRYDFSLRIADTFDLDKKYLKKAKMDEIKWIAKRPKDSSLDISKISKYKKPYRINQALLLLKKDIVGRSKLKD